MSLAILALSGFLGLPKDFRALNLNLELEAPNLWLMEPEPLWNWARRFNQRREKKVIILGYSMGGRLALHAILQNPELYQAAIIIAAHPGLSQEREREARYEQDSIWAQNFKKRPWSELMAEWNNLPALRSSIAIVREEKDYSRLNLSRALRYFSLGEQDYLVPAINKLTLPILWITPLVEKTLLENLELGAQHSQLIAVPNSGHRLIFEQSCLVSKAINNWAIL